jgi:hypothetical protein
MQRLIDLIIRSVPIKVVVLGFYILGGLAIGLAGYIVNAMIFESAWSISMFVGIGGVIGLVMGIWAIIEN